MFEVAAGVFGLCIGGVLGAAITWDIAMARGRAYGQREIHEMYQDRKRIEAIERSIAAKGARS
jgi:uncharacterized membrane protein YdjX (TVP38/TMEM64 family)